ncbi:endonuclease III domain-containing protein [Schaalia suimastitidis]|uniref:endonuclease III domain-containing protein n=1 Tax=Schaalia suimastitidis TaxID=121163 RepID=UPI0004203856|nr:endonuclease III [Schaalia suimastitidis]
MTQKNTVPRAVDEILAMIDGLNHLYPDARCALNHSNAFELLVATVLSAQTTDVRVNQVTPVLFGKWPTPHRLSQAPITEVEAVVRPLGFQRRRAAHIIALSHDLVEYYGGEVPGVATHLEALAGVGHKTANVVLGNWFGGSYLTVDTHVGRLSRRFGWAASTNPAIAERQIVAVVEQASPGINLTRLSHQLIDHGRAVCSAKNPACGTCALRSHCPRIGL